MLPDCTVPDKAVSCKSSVFQLPENIKTHVSCHFDEGFIRNRK